MRQNRSLSSFIFPIWLGLLSTLTGIALMLVTRLALPLPLRASLLAAEAAILVPALLILTAAGADLGASLGLSRIRLGTVLLSVAAGLSLWLGSLGLMELQYAVWKPAPEYLEAFQRLFESLRPHGPVEALASIAAIAIGPAFFEEAMCRGVLLPSLARKSGTAAAVFASALIFALLHLDPYRAPFAFAVGLGFGALRVKAGSTWASIWAHTTLNATTYLIASSIKDPGAPLLTAHAHVAVVCLITGVLASYWIIHKVGRSAPR